MVVMQRSKTAVSVEVKKVIGTLCRVLASTGLDAVPAPEAFRRAKFGGGLEVESQFWQLLASVLHRSGIVHSGVGAQPKGATEYRKLVAAGLWQTGYCADWMYRGEKGEGQEGRILSSKDLLLALGWLLATGTIEKLLTLRVQQLDKTLLTSMPVNSCVSRDFQFDLASLQRLQWLIGNLKHQGRILLSMLEERTRLLHTVFSSCLYSAAPSLSDQGSTALYDDCARMQQLCELLEAYLNWKQVENIFWTWMDSVVDCYLLEPAVKEPSHLPKVSARQCHQLNQKLEDMLIKLPTAQAYRARLQAERPVRHNSYAAEGLCNKAEELQHSQAARLLLQTEAQLLQRRDQQRLHNRITLQPLICKLDKLVLIP